mmetsp:Transcript_10075/g.22391  ORF Transcript_10075/g.22391 Transcript_10075/m.22391 type:complete len:83 (-) Transcript_10075:289-537(-)
MDEAHDSFCNCIVYDDDFSYLSRCGIFYGCRAMDLKIDLAFAYFALKIKTNSCENNIVMHYQEIIPKFTALNKLSIFSSKKN